MAIVGDGDLEPVLREENNDSLFLLIPLLPLFIIAPILAAGIGSGLLTTIFLTFLLIAAVYVMRRNRKQFLISCILGLIAIELFWVSVLGSASALALPGAGVLLIFLVHLSFHRGREYLISASTSPVDTLVKGVEMLLLLALLTGTALHIALFPTSSGWNGGEHMRSLSSSFLTGLLVVCPGGLSDLPAGALTRVIEAIGSFFGLFAVIIITAKTTAGYLKKL